MTDTTSTSAKLRDLLAEPGLVIVPSAYDALTSKMVEQAGFDAVVLAGGALSGFSYGVPDSGFVSASDLLEAARRISSVVDIPLILDFDDAGGTPLQAFRGTQLAVRAGAAALLIEDMVSTSKQLWRKDWHPSQLVLRPISEMVAILEAAVEARGDSGPLIVARSDAYATTGRDDLAERLDAYTKAGADVLYPVGAPIAELGELQGATPRPIMMYASSNPTLEQREELVRAGVKIVLVVHTINGAVAGFQDALERVHRGELLPGENADGSGGWFAGIVKATDAAEWAERERRFAG
jgi:2-methylisocitrate lyase-like PEP mutase family enzyme